MQKRSGVSGESNIMNNEYYEICKSQTDLIKKSDQEY